MHDPSCRSRQGVDIFERIVHGVSRVIDQQGQADYAGGSMPSLPYTPPRALPRVGGKKSVKYTPLPQWQKEVVCLNFKEEQTKKKAEK
jgi:hypothetical protein